MKILIVASWFPDGESPFSGVFIAEQARALASKAAGHEVTVVSPVVIPAGKMRHRMVEERDGYKVIRTSLPARNVVHQFDYARAIVSEIRTSECDVVHAHVTLPAGFASVLAARWTGRPVVITEHRGPFSALMETARDRFKVRFALERADAVLAVSNSLAEEMRSHGVTRTIKVVPNIVDQRRFPLTPKTRQSGEPYKLLFAGILRDHNKNLPLLLRALKQLLDARGDFRLTIVGDGEVRYECEDLARQLGVSEQCVFRGALPPDEVAREIAASDLFVLPSRSETFGIVAAESLSMGRPVVATRCGGPEDFVSDSNGALVPVDDEEALSDAIARVSSSLDDYSAVKLSAYAQERFGDQTVTSQLTDIYREVSQTSARSRRAALML
ncbi:MAG: glycosyltransferase [Acidobacteriota bacterium]